MELRRYQHHAIADIREGFRKQNSLIYRAETGSGKTVVAGSIVKMLHEKGNSGLFIVHRRELVEQAVRTLNEFGLGDLVGVIAAGFDTKPDRPLQVASIQSLHRRTAKTAWLQPKLVVFDECHHISSRTWGEVANRFPDALRLGLTATPVRSDGKGLAQFFDAIVEGPSHMALLEAKALCPAETWELPNDVDISKLKKAGGDFSATSLARLENGTATADAVHAIHRHAPRDKTIVFARSIDHSQRIAEQLNYNGIKAKHVDGDTPVQERADTMRLFADGDVQVVTNCSLISEGFDAPSCSAVVLARPTCSTALHLQQIGRALRYQPNKTAKILDVSGNCKRLGIRPGNEIQWTLEHGEETSAKLREVPTHRVCKDCFLAYERKLDACPACGSTQREPLPDEVKLDLELTKQAEQQAKIQTKQDRTLRIIETGGDLAKLQALAKEWGYKPNWPYFQLKAPWRQAQWRKAAERKANA